MKLREFFRRDDGASYEDIVVEAEIRNRLRKVGARHAIAQRIADDLNGAAIDGEIVDVRIQPAASVGPMGGESDRMTVVWGHGQDCVVVHINVYANGVMAPERERAQKLAQLEEYGR